MGPQDGIEWENTLCLFNSWLLNMAIEIVSFSIVLLCFVSFPAGKFHQIPKTHHKPPLNQHIPMVLTP